jgi:hypothetical protein
LKEKIREKYTEKLRQNNTKEKEKILLYRSKSYKDTTKLKPVQFRHEDYLKNFKVSTHKVYDEPVVKKVSQYQQEEECDCDECRAEREELEAITSGNNIITNIKKINEDVECDCDECKRERKTKLVRSKSFNVKSYTPAFGPPVYKYNKTRNNYENAMRMQF